ncbi:MAG: hypothetical protein K2N28_09185 [Muribaculaceae bacterium]|nr:hypothetical protein [Muribaculaceae bacterium]
MNKLSKYLLIAGLISTTAACRPTTDTADVDLEYVRELGYRHAAKYRELDSRSTEMQRQDFLLSIRALETRLAAEVGEAYAREFSQAFADSAFTAR